MTALPPRQPGLAMIPAVLERDRAWSVCPSGPSHSCLARVAALARRTQARPMGSVAPPWERECSDGNGYTLGGLADLEVLAQRLADHRRSRFTIPLGPLRERVA
jgi:hypothetical protein